MELISKLRCKPVLLILHFTICSHSVLRWSHIDNLHQIFLQIIFPALAHLSTIVTESILFVNPGFRLITPMFGQTICSGSMDQCVHGPWSNPQKTDTPCPISPFAVLKATSRTLIWLFICKTRHTITATATKVTSVSESRNCPKTRERDFNKIWPICPCAFPVGKIPLKTRQSEKREENSF